MKTKKPTPTEEPDLNCPHCGGTGGVDSGGFTPWGAPIDIPCGCISAVKPTPTERVDAFKSVTHNTVDWMNFAHRLAIELEQAQAQLAEAKELISAVDIYGTDSDGFPLINCDNIEGEDWYDARKEWLKKL